jgi:hypothetical protein
MNRRTTAASQRIPGTQVKREIQAHYDDLGVRALKTVSEVQELLRISEGDRSTQLTSAARLTGVNTTTTRFRLAGLTHLIIPLSASSF